MNPAALAATAAAALVAAMTTDTWPEARESAVALWVRVHPDRADAVRSELDEARAEVLAARRNGDTATEKELVTEWRARLLRLIRADPGLAPEFREITQDVRAATPGAADQAAVRKRGYNSVAGRDSYFAGRDLHKTSYHQTFAGNDQLHALFSGKGPGRLLILIGLAVAGFCVAGWASIVMNNCATGPSDMLGPRLPSGIRIGAVYFLGCGLGGVVAAVGGAMAKSQGARAVSRWIFHWITVLAIVAILFLSLTKILGDAPLSALKPNFGSCKAIGSTFKPH